MEDRREQFHAGTLSDGWRWFGAHSTGNGWRFRVWAPCAAAVSVVGDFNGWTAGKNQMTCRNGVWETEITGLRRFDVYKFAVEDRQGGIRFKADPYAFHAETRPATASKLYDLPEFPWSDADFCAARRENLAPNRPLNIYEVHLGSWKRRENGDFYDYRSMAEELAPYVREMGYTAVELLPVTEHPLDDSWGYQCTGYFAPTSRFGTPEDFMRLVNCFHRHGIAVILDWVPAHFCKDAHGLMEFDGSCCYEYADPRKQEHLSWGTRVFDYGRPEVVSFLLSSARYWLEEYHLDGLRVDAVASMLYLDYDRPAGEWTPNRNGGRENLEAIAFLQTLNRTVHEHQPGALMIAEESTAWPQVTGDAADGGLGFDLKWNMGWMNDTCHYLKLDPWFRQYHHQDLTFPMAYAFSEHFVLPVSHDEVVHMKGSLVNKMPGEYENQLRCLRGFYAYMLACPGKKLLFMGAEIGQWHEWDANGQLDWYLLEQPENRQTQRFFRDANRFYLEHAALWRDDFDWSGFEWLVADDNHNNVAVFLRRDDRGNALLCASNFSPNAYEDYRVGVSAGAAYLPVFSTDAAIYGGGDLGDKTAVTAEKVESHGKPYSIRVKIPPFGTVFYQSRGELPPENKVKRKETV